MFGNWLQAKKKSRKKPIAVVTMVHNEPDMLPVWLEHYAIEVGLENCYVIDHGSDDGITDKLHCNVTRLSRTPFDDEFRSKFISGYCAALLNTHETIIYTDCDELVYADPKSAKCLSEFVVKFSLPPIGFVLGMDVVHALSEAPLVKGKSILSQRQWARPSHALCKPLVIRQPFQWAPGFHYTNEDAKFSSLYMFHVAYADEDIIRRRQKKRNASAPVSGGYHHAYLPEDMVLRFRNKTPWNNKFVIDLGGCEDERNYLETLIPWSCQPAPMIWQIPTRFRRAHD